MIKQREANSWKSVSYAKSITGAQTYTKFPIVLRTTEQSIPTWSMNGNVETSGTPSPQNPVMPNGVGDMSSNLINYQLLFSDNPIRETENFRYYRLSVKPNTQYTLKSNAPSTTTPSAQTTFLYGDSDTMTTVNNGVYTDIANTVTSTADGYIFVAIRKFYQYITEPTETDFANGTYTIMINEGSTALPYEPYGQYKIPITNGGVTTNIYLGSTQSTRQIRKFVFTGSNDESWVKSSRSNPDDYLYHIDIGESQQGAISDSFCTHEQYSVNYPTGDTQGFTFKNYLTGYRLFYINVGSAIMNAQASGNTVNGFREYLQAQYAAGTPVTLWYILETPNTATVNEPLMKIGTYADSISNAAQIPTTSGLNTIDVNTTVKPSEMSLTYDGYKICKHKRKSENLLPTAMSDWQQGGISSADGTDTISTIRLRTTGYYPIANDTYYYISVRDTSYCYVNLIFYDSNKNFIGQYYTIDGAINGATALAIRIPSSTFQNVAYYRAVVKKQNESTITVQNIIDVKPMLNTGSTALPYAPYWQ